MARFLWDPDVNVTRRRPAGMTSKPTPGDEPTPVKGGKVIKSKQYRKVAKPKSRLAVQGTEKRQSVALMKQWQYRNFKRCGQCGAYDTYKSRNPEWTRTTVIKKLSDLFPTVPSEVKSLARADDGADASKQEYSVEVEVTYWCYKCGAINEAVTAKYEGSDEFAPKERPNCCVECGKEISFARGDLAWATGETDPSTHRKDYRCDACEKDRISKVKADRVVEKGGEKK